MELLFQDKRNGVVILDRWSYMSKIYDIVNDESKFLKLSSDPTLRREQSFKDFYACLKIMTFSLRSSMIIYILVTHNLPEYTVPLRQIS